MTSAGRNVDASVEHVDGNGEASGRGGRPIPQEKKGLSGGCMRTRAPGLERSVRQPITASDIALFGDRQQQSVAQV